MSRATGYTPYFLLYGKNCLFPFDLTDRTWFALDWHKVSTTEDLLTIRLQQIARKEEHIGKAVDNLKESRQRSVDDYNKKHARSMVEGYEPGTWVLVHETWLDNQHGNKGALRWAGPYVVQERHPSGSSYAIRELNGVMLKETVAASRLKLFYYRDDHQVMHSEVLTEWEDLATRHLPLFLFPSHEGTFEDFIRTNTLAEIVVWRECLRRSNSNLQELVRLQSEVEPWW